MRLRLCLPVVLRLVVLHLLPQVFRSRCPMPEQKVLPLGSEEYRSRLLQCPPVAGVVYLGLRCYGLYGGCSNGGSCWRGRLCATCSCWTGKCPLTGHQAVCGQGTRPQAINVLGLPYKIQTEVKTGYRCDAPVCVVIELMHLPTLAL